jgi:hypothetical protein
MGIILILEQIKGLIILKMKFMITKIKIIYYLIQIMIKVSALKTILIIITCTIVLKLVIIKIAPIV